jgi:hypothetical protein
MQVTKPTFSVSSDLQKYALPGFSRLIFIGFQAAFSAVNENPDSMVFKDTAASCCGLDRLNPTVESFSAGPLLIGEENHVRMLSRRFFSIHATFLMASSLLRMAHACHKSRNARPHRVAFLPEEADQRLETQCMAGRECTFRECCVFLVLFVARIFRIEQQHLSHAFESIITALLKFTVLRAANFVNSLIQILRNLKVSIHVTSAPAQPRDLSSHRPPQTQGTPHERRRIPETMSGFVSADQAAHSRWPGPHSGLPAGDNVATTCPSMLLTQTPHHDREQNTLT